MDGFEAYHALDCGGGEIVSISLMRDQAAAQESDERALEFVRRELADFDVERSEVIGGEPALRRRVGEAPPASSPAEVDEPEVASRKAHFERLHAAS
jgi:hypothetical protein